MIPNLHIRNLVIETAGRIGVPVQLSAIEGGATDGAAIHLHAIDVPSVGLCVAARHIHSYSSIIHRQDYDNAVKLLLALINRLDANTVASLAE